MQLKVLGRMNVALGIWSQKSTAKFWRDAFANPGVVYVVHATLYSGDL